MCTYSMIMDHYWDKWQPYRTTPPMPVQWPFWPPSPMFPAQPGPTTAEIEEFSILLAKAKEYDKRTGQEDCELESKKDKIRQLATELGITITFP